jgi:hypothetical protein
VLFSSSEVSKFINDNFEPAWESVRPAPLVTIDFGNGHVVRRTLQGNVATYVCSPDGTVYDVLPGIYAPDVYRKQLDAIKKLADSLRPRSGAKPPETDAEKRRAETTLVNRLRAYHTQQATLLQTAPPPTPQMQAVAQIGGGFKGGGGFGGGIAGFGGNIGGGGFQAVGFGGLQFGGGGVVGSGVSGTGGTVQSGGIEGPLERVIAGQPQLPADAVPSGPLAKRPELALDSQVNERIRRKAVHDRLARAGLVRPDDIKKWLYKDVLHADLDDPTLGIGDVLNRNYPFAEEDRAAAGKR